MKRGHGFGSRQQFAAVEPELVGIERGARAPHGQRRFAGPYRGRRRGLLAPGKYTAVYYAYSIVLRGSHALAKGCDTARDTGRHIIARPGDMSAGGDVVSGPGGRRYRFCGGQSERSDGRPSQAFRRQYWQQGHRLVWREQCAGEANRGRRAGRRFHLCRPRLDGLLGSKTSTCAEYPVRPPAQRARIDRAGIERVDAQDRSEFRSGYGAGQGEARHGQSRQCTGGQIRQERPREARSLEERREAGRPRRERARRTGAGFEGRSALRHRVQDRCPCRQGRANRRYLSDRQPPADHLSRGVACLRQVTRQPNRYWTF